MKTIIFENIRLNAVSNITVHPVALFETPGKIKLYLRPSTNPLASGIFRTGKISYTSEVIDSTTLDLLVAEHQIKHVRLMKIDCEGAEYFVIEGGKEVLSQKKIDFIAMEYHPTLGSQALQRCMKTHAQLISHGYVLTKINGQTIYHLPGLHDILKPLGNVQVNCKL